MENKYRFYMFSIAEIVKPKKAEEVIDTYNNNINRYKGSELLDLDNFVIIQSEDLDPICKIENLNQLIKPESEYVTVFMTYTKYDEYIDCRNILYEDLSDEVLLLLDCIDTANGLDMIHLEYGVKPIIED